MPNPSPDLPAEQDLALGRRQGRIRAVVLIVAFVALGWDLTRQPAKQWTAWLMVRGIGVYQQRISTGLSRAGVRCRFEPTCSRYAAASIEKYGSLEGGWRSARRLVRCGPWTEAGTSDPP